MWLEAARDIAIVLLAVESLVIGVLMCLMLLQLRKLVQLLREEIAPILHSANDTASRVQGTVGLVSETVVGPLIRVSSYTAGAKQAIRNLLFIGRNLDRRSTQSPDPDDGRDSQASGEPIISG